MIYRTLIIALIIAPLSATVIDNVETQIKMSSGYRWDNVLTEGHLQDISVSPAASGNVQGDQILRRLKNIHLWRLELGAQATFNQFVVLSGHFAYDIFFDYPAEELSALFTNNTNFSQLIIDDYVKFTERDFGLDGEITLGTRLKLSKNYFTMTPKIGLGAYKLSITPENNMFTWGLFIGFDLAIPLHRSLDLTAGYQFHFPGARRERIAFIPRSSITVAPARLINGGFWGSSAQAGIQWHWATRWDLSLSWQYRNLTANSNENTGFGGLAFLKTVWTSQNASLSLKYTY